MTRVGRFVVYIADLLARPGSTETVQVFRIDASAPSQARDAVALRKEMKAGKGASSSSRALAAL